MFVLISCYTRPGMYSLDVIVIGTFRSWLHAKKGFSSLGKSHPLERNLFGCLLAVAGTTLALQVFRRKRKEPRQAALSQ